MLIRADTSKHAQAAEKYASKVCSQAVPEGELVLDMQFASGIATRWEKPPKGAATDAILIPVMASRTYCLIAWSHTENEDGDEGEDGGNDE